MSNKRRRPEWGDNYSNDNNVNYPQKRNRVANYYHRNNHQSLYNNNNNNYNNNNNSRQYRQPLPPQHNLFNESYNQSIGRNCNNSVSSYVYNRGGSRYGHDNNNNNNNNNNTRNNNYSYKKNNFVNNSQKGNNYHNKNSSNNTRNNQRATSPRLCTYGDKCFNIKCKFEHPSGANRNGIVDKRVKYKVEAKGTGDMFVDQQKLTDPKKIQQRKKQINLGKDTKGYFNYIKLIPKNKRNGDYKAHPRTPDHTQALSNRNWNGQMRVWREALHQFDDVVFEDDDVRIYPLSKKINEIVKVKVGEIFVLNDGGCIVIQGPTLRPEVDDLHKKLIAEIEKDQLI